MPSEKSKFHKRHDFANIYIEHIENNGGIDDIVERLPTPEAKTFTAGVYRVAKNSGRITYTQYFSGIGTLVHYEILELA